ncbi:RNA polymerase sigma factor [Dactylosporangium siamense]|uniref:DNA-directed RNA polymerase sigma-70 factor n=1 Tax=Dactylosporangium siamense TaxID=685454 RepID=A0A919PRZ0_9ACTN|nr:sigma factor-like helix-turn-helix DNA-binding protein [Dactylosporangium siamense]GIG48632.1 DNA-directed RNA polymerase sigma-70 factor [Dactylosporangium siamense]
MRSTGDDRGREVDPALVRRAQRGDALAIDELLRILDPYVGRLCAPIALQDAADAAQESMIVIFRSIGQLREPAALFGWVRTICTREAVRVARRRTGTLAAELSDLPAPGDPQLRTDILDVLRRLSPEHRAMLVLRDLEGLDEKAVAGILDLPLGTVRSRLSRARSAFRDRWR